MGTCIIHTLCEYYFFQNIVMDFNVVCVAISMGTIYVIPDHWKYVKYVSIGKLFFLKFHRRYRIDKQTILIK